MKNSSLIINCILAVAVGILYYLHFKGTGKAIQPIDKKEVKQLTSPRIELKASTVVFINSDTLWNNYEFVKETKKVLEKARSNAEANFAAKYKALEDEYNQLKEKAPSLTQEQGMALQQELAMKEQKLAEYRDQQNESLLKNEQEKNDRIQQSITEFLEKNYNNTTYTYILGYSHGGGILYAKESMDITKEVLEGINNEYRAQKKGK